MAEVWLDTNRRALWLGMLLPATIATAGLAALAWSLWSQQHWGLQLGLAVVTAAALWMVGELMYALRCPRLAYEEGTLLVYLEPTRPTRLPVEIVECFFLGMGQSDLPALEGAPPKTRDVVIRLAERAEQWRTRPVRPQFGQWCDGYITLRGTWCQPLTPQLLKELNHKLATVQRQQRRTQREEVA
jgi:hypothetical protein